MAEHECVLRSCFRVIWRAALRRGRIWHGPSAAIDETRHGRDRSASLHLVAAEGRSRAQEKIEGWHGKTIRTSGASHTI